MEKDSLKCVESQSPFQLGEGNVSVASWITSVICPDPMP
jgi:hypothetical protein